MEPKSWMTHAKVDASSGHAPIRELFILGESPPQMVIMKKAHAQRDQIIIQCSMTHSDSNYICSSFLRLPRLHRVSHPKSTELEPRPTRSESRE